MRFALLQLNFTVGDIEGNAVKAAKEQNVNLCITSELALMGYPPRDLLLNRTFINKTQEKITQLAVVLTESSRTGIFLRILME